MRSPNMDNDGRVWKWAIEPHPYTNDYDTMVTDSDEEAKAAILYAAESYLWDTNDGEDDGPRGATRTLSVTHAPGVKESTHGPQ